MAKPELRHWDKADAIVSMGWEDRSESRQAIVGAIAGALAEAEASGRASAPLPPEIVEAAKKLQDLMGTSTFNIKAADAAALNVAEVVLAAVRKQESAPVALSERCSNCGEVNPTFPHYYVTRGSAGNPVQEPCGPIVPVAPKRDELLAAVRELMEHIGHERMCAGAADALRRVAALLPEGK